MDAAKESRLKEKERLLNELAELLIEDQLEEGLYAETPHFGVIEDAAIELGNELSRAAQERGSREIAASCDPSVACPHCDGACQVLAKKREITSKSGAVKVTETVARCPRCRWTFFPSENSDRAG